MIKSLLLALCLVGCLVGCSTAGPKYSVGDCLGYDYKGYSFVLEIEEVNDYGIHVKVMPPVPNKKPKYIYLPFSIVDKLTKAGSLTKADCDAR